MRAIYVDGQPHNLEAAAYDALAWLEYASHHEVGGEIERMNTERLRDLYVVIAALRRYVPSEKPEFVYTTAA